MFGWLRSWRGLALALAAAWLAACTRPAPPGPPLPTLPPETAAPTLTAAPSETAPASLAPETDTAPAATASSPPLAVTATPSAWPTIQTATPLFLADLPTLEPGGSPIATATPPVIAATFPPEPVASAGATAAPAPFITFFTIEPTAILPGQPVTLTWQASGDQVTLQRIDIFGRLGEFSSVGASGQQVLSPPPEQRGQVEFVLVAARGGVTVQATARAAILCPDTWFFANPPPECPASPPNATAMQAQTFERGLMLWTQHNDFIYALYDDGGHPRWDAWANAWFPGQLESDPNLVPPAGLYQPVRGFGLAWRTGYVSPTQVARDRLGWATAPEAPIPNAQVQCDSLPRYSRCYLTGPGGVVYVLQPERSGWGVWNP